MNIAPRRLSPCARNSLKDHPITLIVARWTMLSVLLAGTVSRGTAQTGDGLLDVPWGTAIEGMRERYALVAADSDSVSARYQSNIRRVNGADVEECLLEFRGDAFAGAAVLTRGADNSRRLLAHLCRVFGRGNKESARSYQWLSQTVHLFYDEDSEGDGYVYWYSPGLFADALVDQGSVRRHPPARERPR